MTQPETPEPMWTAAERARELALIRRVLELQIDFYGLTGDWPAPQEIQRQLHGWPHNEAHPHPVKTIQETRP